MRHAAAAAWRILFTELFSRLPAAGNRPYNGDENRRVKPLKDSGRNQTLKKKQTTIQPIEAVAAAIQHKQAQILLDGQLVPCQLPGALAADRNALTVGDRVALEPVEGGQYRLTQVLARQGAVFRGDRRAQGKEILMAANVQLLLAVIPADCLLKQAGFPEAAAIAAGRAGVRFGLYVSKWDCIGESAQALLQERLEPYRAAADFVCAGPFANERNTLLRAVRGKTVLLAGSPGSGKTTLVRLLLSALSGQEPPSAAPAGTSTSVLIPGLDGTRLIDTPGFRDFALTGVTGRELDTVFPEIAGLLSGCAFGNCTHTHEDGCAVRAAVREKRVCRERYEAWRKLGGNASRPAAGPDYRKAACTESFPCKVCGELITPEGAGSRHRNHCPHCLSSIHVDDEPGDRSSLCGGIMDPVSVWVRKDGEWAVIHRCRLCGALHSNRIAADDNPALLMSIAVRPLARTPFPLNRFGEIFSGQRQ